VRDTIHIGNAHERRWCLCIEALHFLSSCNNDHSFHGHELGLFTPRRINGAELDIHSGGTARCYNSVDLQCKYLLRFKD
jgi:hypothetical protein